MLMLPLSTPVSHLHPFVSPKLEWAPKYSLVKGQYSNGSHPQIIALRTKPAHLPKHMLIKGAARSLWGELTGSREWHRANLHTDRYM